LFTRLCNIDVQSRYSAEMALNHPWITRKFNSPIPITIYEEDTLKQLNAELKNIVRIIFFSSSIVSLVYNCIVI